LKRVRPYERVRSALRDCAGTIIYSRRRMVFLEVHWLAPMDCRVPNRFVADLAGTAMDGYEACSSVSQKMTSTFTKSDLAKINAASI